jgi:hypothetical protein
MGLAVLSHPLPFAYTSSAVVFGHVLASWIPKSLGVLFCTLEGLSGEENSSATRATSVRLSRHQSIQRAERKI